jgi:hypothetical protein
MHHYPDPNPRLSERRPSRRGCWQSYLTSGATHVPASFVRMSMLATSTVDLDYELG